MGYVDRIKLLWKTQTRKDPAPEEVLAAYKKAVETLQIKANNLQVMVARAQAEEEHLKADCGAALAKAEALAGNPAGDLLRREAELEALTLGKKLAHIEDRRARLERAHQSTRAGIKLIATQGEALEGRLRAAEATRSVYAASSGLDEKDGISPVERLLQEVRKIEAQSEAAFELSSLDMQIDQKTVK